MMNAVNTKYIPKECVRKCDTWIMLTRQHAHAVLVEIPALVGSAVWPHFSRVKVADEIFMPTMMTVIGAIKGGGVPGGSGKRMDSGDPAVVDQRTDQVERRKTTHVDWSKGGPHPKAFTEFTLQVSVVLCVLCCRVVVLSCCVSRLCFVQILCKVHSNQWSFLLCLFIFGGVSGTTRWNESRLYFCSEIWCRNMSSECVAHCVWCCCTCGGRSRYCICINNCCNN